MRIRPEFTRTVLTVATLLLSVGGTLPPRKAVRIDVIFLDAKNDGSGIDKRVDDVLREVLSKSMKGSPTPAPPMDKFDSYAWIGTESRELDVDENDFVPWPAPLTSGWYLEYRGLAAEKDSGDATRHKVIFGVRSKTGEIKDKKTLLVADAGSFIQGVALKSRTLFIVSRVTTLH
jgi:hypothetical protein